MAQKNAVTIFGQSKWKEQLPAFVEKECAPALPDEIKPDKFRVCIQNTIIKNPKLLEVPAPVLYGQMKMAAHDGLYPDGREAALVPFYDKRKGYMDCTYMPMVRGLLKQLHNTGEVQNIQRAVVYEGDSFDYQQGTDPFIRHRPDDEGKPGAITHAYVVIRLKGSDIPYTRVWPRHRIDKVRAVAKTKKIWDAWYEEKAMVVVIRNLIKDLPLSSERLNSIIESDNAQYVLEQDVDDGLDAQGKPRALTNMENANPAALEQMDQETGEVIDADAEEVDTSDGDSVPDDIKPTNGDFDDTDLEPLPGEGVEPQLTDEVIDGQRKQAEESATNSNAVEEPEEELSFDLDEVNLDVAIEEPQCEEELSVVDAIKAAFISIEASEGYDGIETAWEQGVVGGKLEQYGLERWGELTKEQNEKEIVPFINQLMKSSDYATEMQSKIIEDAKLRYKAYLTKGDDKGAPTKQGLSNINAACIMNEHVTSDSRIKRRLVKIWKRAEQHLAVMQAKK